MTPSRRQQIVQIVSDVLNLPVDRIMPSTSPADVEGWDSVQHLNLVLAIEQATGIQLSPEDIEGMQTVGAILDVVERRGP
jgi:acyl carrier protein